MSEITINLEEINPVEFLGVNNTKLSLLRNAFPQLKITARGNKIKIAGSAEQLKSFSDIATKIISIINQFGSISPQQITNLLQYQDAPVNHVQTQNDVLVYGVNGIIVKAKTRNQKKMVEMIEKNDILFAVGPAGTGKTYTAVALAVRALKLKQVKKIILTRPAVEAGESLGFLPGDLKEKIDPYLRPLYDALDDMIPFERLNYYMNNRIIEIAPLAFMRGRTLDHAFIILDEAQNATTAQLKMFLTRLGPSAKCIITGDLTQVDLPRHQESGLITAIQLLQKIKGIATVRLSEKDVIRHPLVKKIIQAYSTLGNEEKNTLAENG